MNNKFVVCGDFILTNIKPKTYNLDNCIWIYNIKKKFHLNIPLTNQPDILRANSNDNNTLQVAIISQKGIFVIYHLFVSTELHYKKIFLFNDNSYPISEFLFCPHSEFMRFIY
jgi:hypothetical protein